MVAIGANGDRVSSGPWRARARAWWALGAARVILATQLLWLVGFSWVEFHRDALTRDFSMYNQATWMIAHGHIDPYDSVMGLQLWRNNGEFILWPLSLLTYLPPEGLWLLWAQDLAIVVTGWVAVAWTAEFLRARPRAWWAGAGVVVATTLWAANPKVYSTAAFDVHTEVFGACFALLAAREFWRGRLKGAWVWLVLVLGTGFVASSYAAALGLAVLTLGVRRERGEVSRRAGATVLVVALAWMGVLELAHGNLASGLVSKYGYLSGVQHPDMLQMVTGVVAHPARVIAQLRRNQSNLWANLAPSGFVGVLNPWGFWMAVPVTFADALVSGGNFASVGFQNFPAFAFVVFGSVVLWDRLMAALRSKLLGVALAGCVGLWAGVSGGAVLPRYGSYWLAVSPSAARTLAHVRELVPARAEVVASQGISGWFSSRSDIRVMMGLPYEVPVQGRAVYFVLSPTVGLQTTSSANTVALEMWLEHSGARVLVHQSDIWLFEMPVRGKAQSVLLPGARSLCDWTGVLDLSAGGCYHD